MYEMDRRSDEFITQAQEAVTNAVDDLDSVDSTSPERDLRTDSKQNANAAGTQTDFKVVMEEPAEEEKSHRSSKTDK